MSGVELFFFIAVGWFSFICLRILVLIRRFLVFPRVYGQVSGIPLDELVETAAVRGEDLPAFRVVIPAFREALVIDGTLRRLAAQNYPRTHYEVIVVTYADEAPGPGEDSTFDVASRTADRINADAGLDFIRILSVPATFDGEFPGRLDAKRPFIGKARGLNYALRGIHEDNERLERNLYIGRMSGLGLIEAMDAAIAAIAAAAAAGDAAALRRSCARFDPADPDFAGNCALSSQVVRLCECLVDIQARFDGETVSAQLVLDYVGREAPRFFLESPEGAKAGSGGAAPPLAVMEDRRFLYDVMRKVEAQPVAETERQAARTLADLKVRRPYLYRDIGRATEGEALYQSAKRIGTRWVAVYDADADPPIELLRHLALGIQEDPGVLGFQGPVAPVANYGDVHPLCRLGGLWMGFWHTTGYPRLLSRSGWAHVLAGTNWCFRVEGSADGGRLTQAPVYNERRRKFLLSFDPRQLTEDLEVAVRIFSEWQVNARWHPLIENEQVPASPRAMIVQRRRWTLGTLQTLSYILRSRLPLFQKLKYSLLPLDIVFSGSGPIVTVALWILVYGTDLLENPVVVAWSTALTFGNLVYVIPYLLAHERFVIGHRRAVAVDYVLDEGPALAAALGDRLEGGSISEREAASLFEISRLLGVGTHGDGFVRRYLSERSEEVAPSPAARALLEWTPAAIGKGQDRDLAERFADLADRAQALAGHASEDAALFERLEKLRTALEKAAVKREWRRRRRRERSQIWRWAFVYLFWQLIPYYAGLFAWIGGRNTHEWVKTPRTRKTNLPSAE